MCNYDIFDNALSLYKADAWPTVQCLFAKGICVHGQSTSVVVVFKLACPLSKQYVRSHHFASFAARGSQHRDCSLCATMKLRQRPLAIFEVHIWATAQSSHSEITESGQLIVLRPSHYLDTYLGAVRSQHRDCSFCATMTSSRISSGLL